MTKETQVTIKMDVRSAAAVRQYTWKEIIGDLHIVYKEELADVRELPFGKISLS